MTTLQQIQHIPAYVSLLQIAKIICSVASMANLYFVFIRRAKFLLILDSFEEIHKIICNPQDGMKSTRRQVQLTFCALYALAWVITLLEISIATSKKSPRSLTFFIINRFIVSSLHSLGTQFLSFSILIIFYMKQINSKIADLQKEHVASSKIENIIKQIDKLREAHNKLWENAHLINLVYGIYLLLPLSFISIHLQTDFFKVIKSILNHFADFPYQPLSATDWLISVLWTFNDFIKLCAYFRAAYLVHTEVKIFSCTKIKLR